MIDNSIGAFLPLSDLTRSCPPILVNSAGLIALYADVVRTYK